MVIGTGHPRVRHTYFVVCWCFCIRKIDKQGKFTHSNVNFQMDVIIVVVAVDDGEDEHQEPSPSLQLKGDARANTEPLIQQPQR